MDVIVYRVAELLDGIERNIKANSDAIVKELVDHKRIQRFVASTIQL